MSPLFDAFDVRYVGSKAGLEVYGGEVDPNWSAGRILVGGYALGLIIEACTKYQEKHKVNHADPVQISCHFIASPDIVPYQVHIKTLKPGRSYTNLYAEFTQNGKPRSHGHNIAIPSPYARRIPLFTHPSLIEEPKPGAEILEAVANFTDDLQTVIDPAWPDRNKPEARERSFEHPITGNTSEKVGGGGVDEGRWITVTPSAKGSENTVLRASLCPFILDLTHSYPELLGAGEHWNPTMTWAITFYGKVPSLSRGHSQTTTGLYTHAKSMVDPDSRQSLVAEWWTAPSGIGQGIVEEGWREKQICMATSEQVAIVVPQDVEMKRRFKL